MMTDETPRIVFERNIIYGSGTHRISIPLEIIKALQLEKGDTMSITLEGEKIVIEKSD